MSDTWEGFVDAVREESRLLNELNANARALTDALVKNKLPVMDRAQRQLEASRLRHEAALNVRMAMQRRGFGQMTLREVCGYAPPEVAHALHAAMADMTYSTIGIGITNNNNKALVAAGLDRLDRTVKALQNARSDKVGVYKRRGNVPHGNASVLVSQRA